ncbi:MAG: tail fiber domain-containing protein [Chitinophagaceae bacterium]|nr:tail fiber domain-containing protein [Chitinophagaceae bacterium]
MINKFSLGALYSCLWIFQPLFAQQVGIGTPTPAASAVLDVSSTTRGLLPPRMTAAQRNAIASPANGLIVFDTDSAALMVRSAGGWLRLTTTVTPGGYWSANGTNIFNLNTGNTGIGTNNPLARLHVADSSVLFSGLNTNSLSPAIPPPIEGPGIRLLWYPQKAAFRAGFAGFNTWDRDNIGTHSFAGGQGTLARGRSSTAFGLGTEATGDFSTATGISTRSRAFGSIAVGAYNNADDNPNPVAAAPEDRIFQIGNGTVDNDRRNALTVLRNGDIGLGNVNSPNAPLQFNNALQNRKIILYEAANDDHRFYGFGINSGVLRYQTDASNADHVFYSAASESSSSELLRIKGSGAIGINQPNPGVYGHGGTARVLEIRNNSDLDANDIQSHLVLSTSGGGGSMGGITWANTTLAGEKRAAFVGVSYEFASTDAFFQVLLRRGNELAQRFRINANGNAWLAGGLTQNSDETLKKNIEPIANASHLLQQLHGYRYQWKDENADAEKQLGLLAQEVQKVLPELVKEGENGKLGVNYSGLIPVLLEALKEQQQKTIGYEKQMQWLLERAAEQERRLIELEKQLKNN